MSDAMSEAYSWIRKQEKESILWNQQRLQNPGLTVKYDKLIEEYRSTKNRHESELKQIFNQLSEVEKAIKKS